MNETVTLANFRTEANFIKEAAGFSGGPEKKVSLGPGTTLIRHCWLGVCGACVHPAHSDHFYHCF
jgi:hypothetical protein